MNTHLPSILQVTALAVTLASTCYALISIWKNAHLLKKAGKRYGYTKTNLFLLTVCVSTQLALTNALHTLAQELLEKEHLDLLLEIVAFTMYLIFWIFFCLLVTIATHRHNKEVRRI